MVEAQGSHGSMSIRDANKLIGINNYYIWQVRMKIILRRENVWDLTENHVQPTKFPITVLGTKYIEKK
jgi:hypothetical protein